MTVRFEGDHNDRPNRLTRRGWTAIALAVVALIIIGAWSAQWGVTKAGASAPTAAQQHRYYVTEQRCGVPAGNYTAQPHVQLRTLNGAYKRAYFIRGHWSKLFAVVVTDAMTGKFVAYLEATRCPTYGGH